MEACADSPTLWMDLSTRALQALHTNVAVNAFRRRHGLDRPSVAAGDERGRAHRLRQPCAGGGFLRV